MMHEKFNVFMFEAENLRDKFDSKGNEYTEVKKHLAVMREELRANTRGGSMVNTGFGFGGQSIIQQAKSVELLEK